jgi:ABC-type molybdenum transport system ATPase subunit/photorepair protein PhrA
MLILDEPLQGLDLHWREWLKTKLAGFCRSRTTLYITHDEEEIPEGDWKVLEL